MTLRHITLLLSTLLCAACSKAKPTADAVCTQLVAAGVATNCVVKQPGGIGAAADKAMDFDLAHDAKGQVLTFRSEADFKATIGAFDAAAVLAGKHRYGSESALTFVQLNAQTPDAVGDKAKAVVDGL